MDRALHPVVQRLRVATNAHDLEALVAKSADAVETIAAEGLEAAQAHFN